jgi:hypothetical protein
MVPIHLLLILPHPMVAFTRTFVLPLGNGLFESAPLFGFIRG